MGDGGGEGDGPPDAEGEDGSDGEEETMETDVIGKLSTQSKKSLAARFDAGVRWQIKTRQSTAGCSGI